MLRDLTILVIFVGKNVTRMEILLDIAVQGRSFYLITGVIEDGEGHGGHVDQGLGKESAVDGQQNSGQEGKVAQDQKQCFGKKKSL